jgi:hypothetical protein
MIYGYANMFNPQKPLTTAYLVERIKLKPAWPTRLVNVANPNGVMTIESIGKVEVEYIDKNGLVHLGTGLSTNSQRFDRFGAFYSSRRSVYSFPQ